MSIINNTYQNGYDSGDFLMLILSCNYFHCFSKFSCQVVNLTALFQ